jgi:HSP20 family protein
MDVLETAEAVEILMDIPGVERDAIRVHVVQGTVIVAGRKRLPACAHGHATFHLAERTCGRFTRAVRLTGAVDVGRATATLAGGELRVILPCIEERRGHDIRIEITVG